MNLNTYVSATVIWSNPYIPDIERLQDFQGDQTHSAHYGGPGAYQSKRVLIVGAGDSGAQIFAEQAWPFCEGAMLMVIWVWRVGKPCPVYATIIGAERSARENVPALVKFLKGDL